MQNPLRAMQGDFLSTMLRASKYPAQDGTPTKTQLEQHVNFESGRWFLCANTHTKVCVC